MFSNTLPTCAHSDHLLSMQNEDLGEILVSRQSNTLVMAISPLPVRICISPFMLLNGSSSPHLPIVREQIEAASFAVKPDEES